MTIFLTVQLKASVPTEICELFEVARSAFVYGLMFYPLVTIGAEQICRVSEAAVLLKCKFLNAPKRENSFALKVKWLIEAKVIKNDDEYLWEYLRQFRNEGSHPKFQTIQTPEICLNTMETAAGLFNDLF